MTLCGSVEGFEFHCFEPLEDSPFFDPFASLVSVWRSKFDGNHIPKWSDFDFTDFRGWHSKLAIYEITYAPYDYTIRISGEEYNESIGRNVMGMTHTEIRKIAVEDRFAQEFQEKACSEMLIAYQRGVNVIDRQHFNFEYLELPLSDNRLHATHSIEAVVRTSV